MREIICNGSSGNYLHLRDELTDLKEQGIKLTLRGKESSPEKIARTCIMSEECNYMRDYITDGEGKIVGIDFNKISLKEL